MTKATTYQVPTVSELVRNIEPTRAGHSELSNLAKGLWLAETIETCILEKCTSTLFENLEEAIEALPRGKERLTYTLPSGREVSGERNQRQSAKKALTTAFNNAVKGWKDTSNHDLYQKYEGKRLTFKGSTPRFNNKALPKTDEDKLYSILVDFVGEQGAWTYTLEILKAYGERYWIRKRSIMASAHARTVDDIKHQFSEFLGMGLSEDTARQACEDKYGADTVQKAMNE